MKKNEKKLEQLSRIEEKCSKRLAEVYEKGGKTLKESVEILLGEGFTYESIVSAVWNCLKDKTY